MELTPREKDKLLIFTAGLLAKQRKECDLKLNYPEAIAYISAAILEGARAGKTVAELMSYGKTLLTTNDVMSGIASMIDDIQVEATFPDGTKLITVHSPILEVVDNGVESSNFIVPGEIIAKLTAEIKLNLNRKTIKVQVVNTGDRPVQVGSHYHFYETNEALEFDREKSRGFRLNIASGTAVRFEPAQERKVELVEYAGDKKVYGFNGKIMGDL